MRDKFEKECKIIQDNCTYTAEAHHIIALNGECLRVKIQVVPAVVAALSSILVVGQVVPAWFGWASATAAIVAAVGGVIDPQKSYYEHLNAARYFTVLKQKARALRETFSARFSDAEFATKVESLHEEYIELVKFLPPTTEEAF